MQCPYCKREVQLRSRTRDCPYCELPISPPKMKCPCCEREVQPDNMGKHMNTKRCRGIRRLNTILEGDYEDVFINGDYDRLFSYIGWGEKVEILGELTEEEYEFRFLRTRTE